MTTSGSTCLAGRPSFGRSASWQSSLMAATLHKDQCTTCVRNAPFLNSPSLISTVDLDGLETILYGPSNLGHKDKGLSTLT